MIEPITLPSKVLEKETVVQWVPKLKDSGIRLRHHVLYSPDGGGTFEPVRINLRKSEVVIEPASLTKSQESTGVLRIYVSDGLNTVHVDIDKLTVKGK